MIIVYFVSGLAYFSLGLASWLEARHKSKIPLGQQLPWLAAFGFAQCLAEWANAFRLLDIPQDTRQFLALLASLMLPLSALLLVRFGIGFINQAGPLPDWLTFIPVVLIVPAGLLVSYALIIAVTEPPLSTAMEVWSRYLLYFSGNLLAAYGFIRQWRGLDNIHDQTTRRLLLGASIFFSVNAVVAGLVVPAASYGLAPWLNAEKTLEWTGIPVQFWRMASALAVTFCVVRAMDLLETDRRQQMAKLDQARTLAQQAALQAQSEARRAAENWTDALVTISRYIADMDEVDEVLKAIVETACRLLNSDTAVLGLWNESRTELQVKCFATAAGAQMGKSRPTQSRLILETVRNCHSYRYFAEESQEEWVCPITDHKIQAAAIVPLQLEGEPVGGLWISRFDPRSFTTTELIGLGHLADQAVIAIEHALMAARLQSLAVLEERSRIAREMHDGLAQILGYMSLEMQTLDVLARQGNREALIEELKQARQNINLAQADVRENILSLRTTLSGEAGVIPALEEYVREFSVQTGIDARLVCDVEEPLTLSPIAETQMVRIIQEALTNVRKHASASCVHIRLSSHRGCLCVTIVDDGIGFAMPPDRGHFGLLTMRERAESVSGGLTITSQPHQGTQVELWLPLMKN